MTMKEDADSVGEIPLALSSTILNQVQTKEDMELMMQRLARFIGEDLPAYRKFSTAAGLITYKTNEIQQMVRKLADELNEYVEDLHTITLEPGTY
jgi:diaminopimelate decarboxylase